MKCPTCQAWATVKEVRQRSDGATRRRYECANLHKFSTVEQAQQLIRGRHLITTQDSKGQK